MNKINEKPNEFLTIFEEVIAPRINFLNYLNIYLLGGAIK